MQEAALRAIAARSHAHDGREKIIPSAHEPAIMIICDEDAVLMGQNMGGPKTSADGVTNLQLSNNNEQITVLGRSEAIDVILASQRGTVTMVGDGDAKSQFGLRIGLGVATEQDARLIIPDSQHLAVELARLRHPGSGIVSADDGRTAPVKFYRIEHDDIAPVAVMTGGIRPAPDARSRKRSARCTRGGGRTAAGTSSLLCPPGCRWSHRRGRRKRSSSRSSASSATSTLPPRRNR